MIEKQKVLYVIKECDLLPMNQNSDDKELLDSIETLEMYKEERKLHLWLEKLSPDELIDLIALMDYGREHRNRGEMNADFKEFERYREDISITFKSEKPSHAASYLLAKSLLSEYLQYALPLYDEIAERNLF